MKEEYNTMSTYIFRMNKYTYNSILEKWDSIGVLDRLTDDKKILAANSFELTLKYLLGSNEPNLFDSNEPNEYSIETNELVTIIFPIIHRIIVEVNIDINDLMLIIETTKKNIPNLIDSLNNDIDGNIDYEAEYCKNLADELILQINNKKE
jgi:hypothetical protein